MPRTDARGSTADRADALCQAQRPRRGAEPGKCSPISYATNLALLPTGNACADRRDQAWRFRARSASQPRAISGGEPRRPGQRAGHQAGFAGGVRARGVFGFGTVRAFSRSGVRQCGPDHPAVLAPPTASRRFDCCGNSRNWRDCRVRAGIRPEIVTGDDQSAAGPRPCGPALRRRDPRSTGRPGIRADADPWTDRLSHPVRRPARDLGADIGPLWRSQDRTSAV